VARWIVKTESGNVVSPGIRAATADEAIEKARRMWPKRLANTKLVAEKVDSGSVYKEAPGTTPTVPGAFSCPRG